MKQVKALLYLPSRQFYLTNSVLFGCQHEMYFRGNPAILANIVMVWSSILDTKVSILLCILLAGDIATNPEPTLRNAQFGKLSHLRVPVVERPKNEFGPSIALANMMSLAPKIDKLRCFANDTKPDLISFYYMSIEIYSSI